MKLTALKYIMVDIKGIRVKVFRAHVVRLGSILGPCYVQPDPVDKKTLYCNHWIGNIAKGD